MNGSSAAGVVQGILAPFSEIHLKMPRVPTLIFGTLWGNMGGQILTT
jgi:hypothetical protein